MSPLYPPPVESERKNDVPSLPIELKTQMLSPVPSLKDLVADPAKVPQLPAEAIPGLLGELERLKAQLWVRLTVPQGNGQADVSANGDTLLDVNQAAQKLQMSKDYLYRHAEGLPFTVRVGKKQLRFSEIGIEKYIRQRMGR